MSSRSKMTTSSILAWAKEELLSDLSSEDMQKADGIEVMKVAIKSDAITSDARYLTEKCLPHLPMVHGNEKTNSPRLVPILQARMQKLEHYRRVDGLLGFLLEAAKKFGISRSDIQHVFRSILPGLTTRITVTHYYLPGEEKTFSRIRSVYLDIGHVVQLLERCVRLKLESEVNQLLNKFEKLAESDEPSVIMNDFFVPLAAKLHTVAKQMQGRLQAFIDKMLRLYAIRYVGLKPLPPQDWSRAKHGCRSETCEVCPELDVFLEDPLKEETTISANSDCAVRHLIGQLPQLAGGFGCGDIPEYETQVQLSFNVQIRKTKKAWSRRVEVWEKDRRTAQKQVDEKFRDEGRRKAFKELLDRLDDGDIICC